MSFVAAQTLIKRMFQVLEVFQPGEAIPADDAIDALAALNMMLGSWSVQPLTMPSITRNVFSLTDDVGVYTIGPGGDFDTVRPIAVTGAGLLLNSSNTPASVTSLTRSGATVTATMPSHGAATGQNVTIRGASPAAYNGTFPITVTGVNTFTYLFSGSPTSPATGTITAAFESEDDDVTEVPRAVITDAAWQAIRVKALRSAQFTDVYYNPTFSGGLGTIHLWPIPNVETNALVLYLQQQIAAFANLTTQYYLPPGCDEAIVYNLARRQARPYGKPLNEDIVDMARMSLATFKRSNVKLVDLSTDPALTHDPSGYYNIVSGTGTNGG